MLNTLAASLNIRGHPHLLSLALEFNMPTFQLIRDVEIQRYIQRLSTLPSTHPSVILFQSQSSPSSSVNQIIHSSHNHFPSLFSERKSLEARWLGSFQPRLNRSLRTEIIREYTEHSSSTPSHTPSLQSIYVHPTHYPFTIPLYLIHDTPHTASIRARLRFNRTTLNCRLSVYDKRTSPACQHCVIHHHSFITEDNTHVLLHCPRYDDLRHRLLTSISTFTSSLSIPLILGVVDHLPPHTRLPIIRNTGIFLDRVQQLRDF
jgi:hypothetical protein